MTSRDLSGHTVTFLPASLSTALVMMMIMVTMIMMMIMVTMIMMTIMVRVMTMLMMIIGDI